MTTIFLGTFEGDGPWNDCSVDPFFSWLGRGSVELRVPFAAVARGRKGPQGGARAPGRQEGEASRVRTTCVGALASVDLNIGR